MLTLQRVPQNWCKRRKNSTTGADASGNISSLAYINALTTYSELSHPTQCSSYADYCYANTEAKQMLISWAWLQNQHASEIAVHVGLGKLFGMISPDPPRYPVAQIEPIVTYELPGSQLWAVLSPEKSRSPATASRVSKSRHNSRTKALNLKFLNTNPSKYRYLLVLLVSTLSF